MEVSTLKTKACGLLLLFSFIGIAQGPNDPKNSNNLFSSTIRASLSSTTSVLTIEHPSGNNEIDQLVSIYMYASSATVITLERSGTAPTATAGTVVSLNPKLVSTTNCTAWTGSNVGTGTVINTYDLNGNFVSLNGNLFQLSANTEDNITLRSSSVTATVVLQIVWQKIS